MAAHILIALSLCVTGAGLTTGEVETVAEGFKFTEGPLWLPGGPLIFSDIPANRMYSAPKAVFREPSHQSNGLTLDGQGRLIAAEHQARRVSRTGKDGSMTVLAGRWEGKRFNSPNDVVVRSDGMVFFTDPPYGLEGGLEGPNAELDFCGVFAVKPGKAPKLLARDFERPNGLAFSPDEKTLYVADTAQGHLRAFDAAEDGALSNGRVFCELPGPDGIKVDTKGNLWATARDGVRVIDSNGELLQTVQVPQNPSNCCFGEADGKTLFITARTGVYRVTVSVPGIHPAAALK